MFRQAKRKPKQFVKLRRDDEDDLEHGQEDEGPTIAPRPTRQRVDGSKEQEEEEEESPVVIRRRHREEKSSFVSQKKRKETSSFKPRVADYTTASPYSFQVDDEQGEDDHEIPGGEKRKKKKKRRSKGMGFGGSTTMVIDEDETDANDVPKGQPPDEAVLPAYSKEALEALMAEQKISKPKEVKEPLVEETVKKNVDNLELPQTQEPEFLAFHEIPETTEHDDSAFTERDQKNSRPFILEDPDDDNWEEQVAKRAGIHTVSKADSRPPIPSDTLTLDALRQTLQGIVHHLTTREEDFEHAIMRREAELAHTQADRKRQQDSIEGAGKACADYQKLRYELTSWVGALRDLSDKVEPIEKSLLDMIALQFETAHREWVHWQDDVCATLHEFGLIDRVLGRPPPDLIAEEMETQLDEFGRDIGSQIRRDRENRCRRRRQKKEAVSLKEGVGRRDQILDYLWTKDDATDRRYDILQEALRVATDDLDEAYASPNRLENCFATWEREYCDEYRQCYGNISLADLAHVFDQAELCRAQWICGFLKTNEDLSTDGKLFPNVIAIPQDTRDSETVATTTSALERAYRKDFIPFVLDLFREYPSAIFLSRPMSQLFSLSIFDIMAQMGKESNSTKELCRDIANAGASVLRAISIPILKPIGDSSVSPASNDRLDDAIRFVEMQQSQWIQDLLLNMLDLWIPTLKRTSLEEYHTMANAVLGFLSETYLFYLSSMPNGLVATEHLTPIWKCLAQTYKDLLESPEFLIQSAPLRAAASAYGLPSLSSRA